MLKLHFVGRNKILSRAAGLLHRATKSTDQGAGHGSGASADFRRRAFPSATSQPASLRAPNGPNPPLQRRADAGPMNHSDLSQRSERTRSMPVSTNGQDEAESSSPTRGDHHVPQSQYRSHRGGRRGLDRACSHHGVRLGPRWRLSRRRISSRVARRVGPWIWLRSGLVLLPPLCLRMTGTLDAASPSPAHSPGAGACDFHRLREKIAIDVGGRGGLSADARRQAPRNDGTPSLKAEMTAAERTAAERSRPPFWRERRGSNPRPLA